MGLECFHNSPGSDPVVWREQDSNPVMTFPNKKESILSCLLIEQRPRFWSCGLKRARFKPSDDLPKQKRINTELFTDRTAALFIVDGRIRNVVRGSTISTGLSRDLIYCMLKMWEWEISGSLFQNDLNGNVKEIVHFC